ncbi:hypothetical protein PHYPSEUDO_008924 [Phytophthora pseudosyringae]|uniref:RxLR effector protein n=1 Tax=Phytophthora pseudosyringae TaxID=221518 RepID=A0A8T1VGB6_9STRA|nr:hypothetical protein PHYPSEUDO_008924 [Phytophthora pseudosyringae]
MRVQVFVLAAASTLLIAKADSISASTDMKHISARWDQHTKTSEHSAAKRLLRTPKEQNNDKGNEERALNLDVIVKWLKLDGKKIDDATLKKLAPKEFDDDSHEMAVTFAKLLTDWKSNRDAPCCHSNHASGVSPRAALEGLGSLTDVLCRSLPLVLQSVLTVHRSHRPRSVLRSVRLGTLQYRAFWSLAPFAANLRVRLMRALQRKTPSFIVHPPTASAAQPSTFINQFTQPTLSRPTLTQFVQPSSSLARRVLAVSVSVSTERGTSTPALPFYRPLLLPEHVPLSTLQHASPAVAFVSLLQWYQFQQYRRPFYHFEM